MTTLFLDTYAIFEIIKASENYKKYQKSYSFITTQFNLIELYYNMLSDGASKEEAKFYLNKFSEFVVPVDNDILVEALDLRFDNRSKKMSYVDWIGYITAKKFDVKFLTGDEDFRSFNNVEFVKGD